MDQTKNIHVFRHGEATYGQGIVPLAEASDLTAVGVKKVRAQARTLIPQIPAGETVAIYASPYGRTLHTAKIIAQVLTKGKVNLAHPEPLPAKELREIMHFNFPYFSLLVNGGNLRLGSKSYEVRQGDTNPDNYDLDAYYLYSAWRLIPGQTWKRYPPEFKQVIAQFETSQHVTARVLRFLVSRAHETPRHIIGVTHNCSVDWLMALNSAYERFTLEPGSYLTLTYAPQRHSLRLVSVDGQPSAFTHNVLKAFHRFR